MAELFLCPPIALQWMSLDFTIDKSVFDQVMAWCHQVTSHYLSLMLTQINVATMSWDEFQMDIQQHPTTASGWYHQHFNTWRPKQKWPHLQSIYSSASSCKTIGLSLFKFHCGLFSYSFLLLLVKNDLPPNRWENVSGINVDKISWRYMMSVGLNELSAEYWWRHV